MQFLGLLFFCLMSVSIQSVNSYQKTAGTHGTRLSTHKPGLAHLLTNKREQDERRRALFRRDKSNRRYKSCLFKTRSAYLAVEFKGVLTRRVSAFNWTFRNSSNLPLPLRFTSDNVDGKFKHFNFRQKTFLRWINRQFQTLNFR